MGTAEPTATNALVTGPPRSGKTTALERTVSRLRDSGYAVAGLSSPEIRRNGGRVGFEIVGLESGRRELMAHVDRDDGPSVGKYRVDVSAVDRVSRAELSSGSRFGATDASENRENATGVEATRERFAAAADCIVIDEIAPMQLASDRFVEETRRALESSVPVLAAIKADSTAGVLGAVESRADTEAFEVEPATRDALPDRLTTWVESRV